MSLGPDRKKSGAVGLGKFEVRETSPSVGTDFQNIGHLEETNLEPIADVEEIIPETGDLIDVKTKSIVHRIGTNLLQTSVDEINLPKNAENKEYAFRYSGMHSEDRFQYFCFPRGKINPSVPLGYKNSKRVLPIRAWGLKQKDVAFDIPEYFFAEARAEIRTGNLQFWINPRDIYAPERGTSKVFDISGFERHGTLNSDFATIWQTGTPESFLRFDGVNDYADFGLNGQINSTDDHLIEIWINILGADGANIPIFGNKVFGGLDAGWIIYRSSTNKFVFKIADGTNVAQPNSTSSILQNVKKHLAVHIDRNGSATLYTNGAADGSASVASVGNSVSVSNLTIGKDASTSYGNFEIGSARITNFGAGLLPSDIAAIVARHYNAEKSYFGL